MLDGRSMPRAPMGAQPLNEVALVDLPPHARRVKDALAPYHFKRRKYHCPECGGEKCLTALIRDDGVIFLTCHRTRGCTGEGIVEELDGISILDLFPPELRTPPRGRPEAALAAVGEYLDAYARRIASGPWSGREGLTRRAILTGLLTIARETGKIAPDVSDAYLAQRSGVSVRSIEEHRAELRRAGWYSITRPGGVYVQGGEVTSAPHRYELGSPRDAGFFWYKLQGYKTGPPQDIDRSLSEARIPAPCTVKSDGLPLDHDLALGLGRTRAMIINELVRLGTAAQDELAQALGLTKATIRAHLHGRRGAQAEGESGLVGLGLVREAGTRKPEGRGRPAVLYAAPVRDWALLAERLGLAGLGERRTAEIRRAQGAAHEAVERWCDARERGRGRQRRGRVRTPAMAEDVLARERVVLEPPSPEAAGPLAALPVEAQAETEPASTVEEAERLGGVIAEASRPRRPGLPVSHSGRCLECGGELTPTIDGRSGVCISGAGGRSRSRTAARRCLVSAMEASGRPRTFALAPNADEEIELAPIPAPPSWAAQAREAARAARAEAAAAD